MPGAPSLPGAPSMRLDRMGGIPLPLTSIDLPYALYVVEAILPPLPVQFVWKNSPRGLSTRS